MVSVGKITHNLHGTSRSIKNNKFWNWEKGANNIRTDINGIGDSTPPNLPGLLSMNITTLKIQSDTQQICQTTSAPLTWSLRPHGGTSCGIGEFHERGLVLGRQDGNAYADVMTAPSWAADGAPSSERLLECDGRSLVHVQVELLDEILVQNLWV